MDRAKLEMSRMRAGVIRYKAYNDILVDQV